MEREWEQSIEEGRIPLMQERAFGLAPRRASPIPSLSAVIGLLLYVAGLGKLMGRIGRSSLHGAERLALGDDHWFRPSRRIGLAYNHHQRVLWRS